jgi:hypothetical protein
LVKVNEHDSLVVRLEALLHELLTAHERLQLLVKQKRMALGQADQERVVAMLEQENECIQAISELEKQRLNVVGELTLLIVPDAPEPMPMKDLAERLAEPARGRLLVLRQQLRKRMELVKTETNVARRATEALVQHMRGIVHTIGAICTSAGVYGPAGGLPNEAAAVSTFNTTA